MSGEARPVRVPTPGAHLGKFHLRRFDVSRETDRRIYEDLRTRGNERGSGITIENIRDQVEVSETTSEDGDRTKSETWYIVVSWWERSEAKETPKDPPSTEKGFYIERPADGSQENA